MSTLTTKGLATGQRQSATILPGNIKAKINGISLKEGNFDKELNPYFLVYHLEGVDLGPEFEGYNIDNDDPSLGRYKGQIGSVKASAWAFKDGVTKTGKPVSRDNSILTSLSVLAAALGKKDELDAISAVTIEDFVAQASNILKGDKYLSWCVAGREYLNTKGYINYDLYLPKNEAGRYTFEALSASPSKLLTYNEAVHLVKVKKAEDVGGFNANAADADLSTHGTTNSFPAPGAAPAGADDFDLPF